MEREVVVLDVGVREGGMGRVGRDGLWNIAGGRGVGVCRHGGLALSGEGVEPREYSGVGGKVWFTKTRRVR